MSAYRESLAEFYRALTNDYLQEVYASGTLTDQALEIAGDELTQRGIALPPPLEHAAEDDAESGPPVILETIARSLNTFRLEILRARLDAEGIPAFVVDGNMNQSYSLISPALGGARLQVPREFVAEAKQLLAALYSGALTATARDVEETG